jgi:hypothetical protein
MVLLLVVFAAGCKKVTEEAGLTGVCPIVISTNPANNATGVRINTLITATFNEVMDFSTFNNTTFTLMQGTTTISGVVTYNGLTATFSPTGNLAINTIYTATITKAVKDPARNSPVNDYVWSFTTTVDNTNPTVISTDPANATTSVTLTKKITATFSEAMNPLTINNTTFILKQGATVISGAVTYTDFSATFSPLVNLVANTTYTATITMGFYNRAVSSGTQLRKRFYFRNHGRKRRHY